MGQSKGLQIPGIGWMLYICTHFIEIVLFKFDAFLDANCCFSYKKYYFVSQMDE
jgi:hypothetical protein